MDTTPYQDDGPVYEPPTIKVHALAKNKAPIGFAAWTTKDRDTTVSQKAKQSKATRTQIGRAHV